MSHVANAEKALGIAENTAEGTHYRHVWAQVAVAHATLAVANELSRMREAFDELAPPITNGSGEVVGRTIDVAAALRAEGHA